MSNIYNTPISVYPNVLATQGAVASLGAFLSSERHRLAVLNVRAQRNPSDREGLKKALPAATICGTFGQRNAEGIEAYNGIICMDFDGKDNPDHTAHSIKSLLAGIPEVFYAAISVSGTGVFALVSTDNTDPALHGQVVDYLGRLFSKIGLVYDRKCKDVVRLRFISYDPEAIRRDSITVFKAIEHLKALQSADPAEADTHRPRPIKVPRPATGNNSIDALHQKVENYIAAIEGSAVDITADYDDWIYIGFALASEFGTEGESMFHRVSYFNPKYDHAQTAKKYSNLLKTGGKIKIGTFFKICHNHGIKL